LTALALAAALAAGGSVPTVSHDDLDAVLGLVVRGESVDYVALRERHLPRLRAYLARIATVEPRTLSRDEQIALYVNAYNATVLGAVAERYRPGYRPDADGFALFDEPLVRLGGATMSLNDLEHRELRARLAEPRVHAALVCAARSCPPLARRAYSAADLDRALDERMRAFVRDPARNRIDAERRTLHLSRIFDWYAADFGGPDGLAAWIGRWAGADVSGFAVEFLPYSWELNDVARGTATGPSGAAGP
jgi:hypothetical protein